MWTKCKVLVEKERINDGAEFRSSMHVFIFHSLFFSSRESIEEWLGTQILEPNDLSLDPSFTITVEP